MGRKNKLISRGENIPNKKSIKFTEKQMPKQDVITLKFSYNSEEYNFTPNPLLNSCIISIPSVKEEQYQFVVQFLLDICCIPHVDRASINETYFEEVPIKEPVKTDKKDEAKKDEAKKEEA